MTRDWDLINKKIEEVVRLIQKEGLMMVAATFGTEDEIDNWQYKIWISKKHQKIKKKKLKDGQNK